MAQHEVDAALLKLGTELDGSGLKLLNDELGKSGKALIKTGETGELAFSRVEAKSKSLTKSLQTSYLAIAGAVFGFKQMADEAITKNKAIGQLTLSIEKNTTAASRQGLSVRAVVKDFQDFADAQEKATGIGDEQTLSLLNMLTTLKIAPGQVKRVAAALQDMEAVTGQSADAMAKSMARLSANPEEALGALSRAGVIVKKEMLEGMTSAQQFDFILGEIEAAFSDQAKTLYKAAGGYGQFKTESDKLTENLGQVLLPVLSEVLGLFASLFGLFDQASGAVKGFIVAAGGLAGVLWGISAASPVGWITGAIFAIGGLMSAVDSLANKTDVLNEINGRIDKANKGLAEIEQQQVVKDDLLKRLATLQQGTAAYERTVKELIKSNAELANSGINVKSSYKDIMDTLAKLDTASAIAKMNRLQDITDEAMASYAQAESQRYIVSSITGRRIGEANDRIQEALNSTQLAALVTVARSLSMQGKFTFDQATPSGGVRISGGAEAQTSGYAAFYRAFQEYMDSRQPEGARIELSSRFTPEMLQEIYNQARTSQATQRGAIDTNISGTSTGDPAKKNTYDMHALRISLIKNEFERRAEELNRDYKREVDVVNASSLSKEGKEQAIFLLGERLDNQLAENTKARIEQEKQARIDAIVSAANTMTDVMGVATDIVKRDWKGAISSGLNMIPGVGSSLSAAFGAAVELFSGLFGSSTETILDKMAAKAEALSAKLEKTAARGAQNLTLTEQIYGEGTVAASDADLSGAKENLQTFLDDNPVYAKLGLDAKSILDFKLLLDQSGDDLVSFATTAKTSLNGILNQQLEINRQWSLGKISESERDKRIKDLYLSQGMAVYDQFVQNIRSQFGSAADIVLDELGIRTDTASSDFSNWLQTSFVGIINQTKKYGGDIAAAMADSAAKAVDLLDKVDDATTTNKLSAYEESLANIQHLLKTGEVTNDAALQQQLAIYDQMLLELKALEQTESVKKTINELEEERYTLAQELAGLAKQDTSNLTQYLNGARGGELQKLLDAKTEIERAIAAGELTAGSTSTVTAQQKINSQIIALLKAMGADSSVYASYQEANAGLSSTYLGNSYSGLTGQGITPLVQDYVASYIAAKTQNTSAFLPRIPATATREYMSAMAQRAVAAASSSNVTNSNNTTTNSNNLVINGQTVPSTQEQFEKIRAYAKQVYGYDLLKGA